MFIFQHLGGDNFLLFQATELKSDFIVSVKFPLLRF